VSKSYEISGLAGTLIDLVDDLVDFLLAVLIVSPIPGASALVTLVLIGGELEKLYGVRVMGPGGPGGTHRSWRSSVPGGSDDDPAGFCGGSDCGGSGGEVSLALPRRDHPGHVHVRRYPALRSSDSDKSFLGDREAAAEFRLQLRTGGTALGRFQSRTAGQHRQRMVFRQGNQEYKRVCAEGIQWI
jgi:hypothetical protein